MTFHRHPTETCNLSRSFLEPLRRKLHEMLPNVTFSVIFVLQRVQITVAVLMLAATETLQGMFKSGGVTVY